MKIINNSFIFPILKSQDELISSLETHSAQIISRFNALKLKAEQKMKADRINLQAKRYWLLEPNSVKDKIETLEFKQIAEKKLDLFLPGFNISTILDLKDFINELAESAANHLKREGNKIANAQDFKNVLVKAEAQKIKFVYLDYKTIKEETGIFGAFRFHEQHPYARTRNAIYITGEDKGFSEVFYAPGEIRSTLCIKKKADLLVDKLDFKLVTFNSDTVIYSIGGEKNNDVFGYCEKYVIALDKWYFIPKLNEERYQMCALALNRFVMCFGGNNRERKAIGSFEILDGMDESAGWTILRIDSKYAIFFKAQSNSF